MTISYLKQNFIFKITRKGVPVSNFSVVITQVIRILATFSDIPVTCVEFLAANRSPVLVAADCSVGSRSAILSREKTIPLEKAASLRQDFYT